MLTCQRALCAGPTVIYGGALPRARRPGLSVARAVPLTLLLVLLSACGAGEDLARYAPAQPLADLEAWAERYPLQYDEWEASAHGQAYLAGKTGAPLCTDCHGDPENGEIRTAAFRLEIPGRCARCHADATLMAGAGLSSDVYATYLADYHGTTIDYYRLAAPSTWRYEAVCSDCHGSHEVYAVDDARAAVSPANLAAACQKCHHGAPQGFASAFGHYRPAASPVSSAESPVLFWVKLFYQALIPVVLGSMAGYIGLDLRHRARQRKPHVKPSADA